MFFLFTVIKKYDYVFAENGLVAYKNGDLIGKMVGKDMIMSLFEIHLAI